MKPAARLALALLLGGAVAWALAGWLRPHNAFELLWALALCR